MVSAVRVSGPLLLIIPGVGFSDSPWSLPLITMLWVELVASIVSASLVEVAGSTDESKRVQMPPEHPGSLAGMLKLIVSMAESLSVSEFACVTASRNEQRLAVQAPSVLSAVVVTM